MVVIAPPGDLPAEVMTEAPSFFFEHRDSVLCEWIESDGIHKKEWHETAMFVPL